ncbi:hypothetical protein A2U01_0097029, partial [Trifolium medium]|nr:hypothetical protein [Trifolium medium]
LAASDAASSKNHFSKGAELRRMQA